MFVEGNPMITVTCGHEMAAARYRHPAATVGRISPETIHRRSDLA